MKAENCTICLPHGPTPFKSNVANRYVSEDTSKNNAYFEGKSHRENDARLLAYLNSSENHIEEEFEELIETFLKSNREESTKTRSLGNIEERRWMV